MNLFIPILTFVFGEALLGRPPALISLHRLRPPFYDLPDGPGRTVNRAGREAIHELGHTHGLVTAWRPTASCTPPWPPRRSTSRARASARPAARR